MKKYPHKHNEGFAHIDYERLDRRGFHEVIFCEGKTREQILEIAKKMYKAHQFVFATRINQEAYICLREHFKPVYYNECAQVVIIGRYTPRTKKKKTIAIVTAGTSDFRVAEEARETARLLGSKVKTFYDVGVAGIHRLFSVQKEIESSNVIIVIAGMEGALPSVVSGITSKPIVAVPTSNGYGTALQGLTPLFAMLNSCSPGVAVMNIDNGFGAGYFAHMINT